MKIESLTFDQKHDFKISLVELYTNTFLWHEKYRANFLLILKYFKLYRKLKAK